MGAGFQINLAGRQIDDEIVDVRVLLRELKFKFQGQFSVPERLFERVGHAPAACRRGRYGYGEWDGNENSEDQ